MSPQPRTPTLPISMRIPSVPVFGRGSLVDSARPGAEDGLVALRRPLHWAAALLLIGSLAAAPPATAAKHKGARFKVVSLVGRQTATWQQVSRYSQACQGEIHESGTQTISFQSTAKPSLKVKRIGSGRFKSAYGTTEVPTDWTFDRTFDRTSTPNTCPTECYAMTA